MNSCGRILIDLNAVERNWLLLKTLLKPDCELGAVVKDDAYGLGAREVSRALYNSGCRTFFFIAAEEAQPILADLPADIRVILLGGFRLGTELFYQDQRLIPVIHSHESLSRWLEFPESVTRPCILKFDTGMSRLGFSLADCEFLTSLSKRINPIVLMSHLACADAPTHAQNLSQLQLFREITATLQSAFPDAQLSLANSAGILLGTDWHFDLARPGAGLYGIQSSGETKVRLENAVTLELPILQIKSFSNSITVGYGATRVMPPDTCLAVVAGGYGDGINRILGSAPKLRYRNYWVPAVGRMSMDSMIFDFTAVPEHDRPQAGDYLQFINDDFSLNYWMNETGSLGYEILTAMGKRFERCYRYV